MKSLKISIATKAALAAIVLGSLLAGCGSPAPDANANKGGSEKGPSTAGGYVLGLVASENGDLRPWGEDSVKGAQLAVDEFNKAGGVDGKLIDLKIEDSASKPEQGKSAAEKLMGDGAIGLVGEVASGITMQMITAASAKGVPIMAVGATKTTLTEGHDNVFRVCYTDAFQGPVMAKFAYDQLKLRNVALMTDKKQPYSTGLSDSFRAYFTKLGGKIVDEQFYESGQTQFSGQLTALKAKSPDGMFMSGYFNETGPIARQAKDAGLNVKMMGGDGWDSNEILTTGGDAILGSFFCNHYNNKETRPEVQDFLKKWAAKYNGTVPATTMGALAYDAMMLTCDGLKRAKTKDSKGLTEALADTVDFPGVSGKITLKGMHGNPPKRALVVQLTKEGQVFAKAYEANEIK